MINKLEAKGFLKAPTLTQTGADHSTEVVFVARIPFAAAAWSAAGNLSDPGNQAKSAVLVTLSQLGKEKLSGVVGYLKSVNLTSTGSDGSKEITITLKVAMSREIWAAAGALAFSEVEFQLDRHQLALEAPAKSGSNQSSLLDQPTIAALRSPAAKRTRGPDKKKASKKVSKNKAKRKTSKSFRNATKRIR